jgi:DNA mismatch repair ATPase MutS
MVGALCNSMKSRPVLQYRSIIFRNFRGDSPVERRSGFSLESKEMAIVLGQGRLLQEAGKSARNFVCIDEFGKGTEDRHAVALCAAALLYMDKVLLPFTT